MQKKICRVPPFSRLSVYVRGTLCRDCSVKLQPCGDAAMWRCSATALTLSENTTHGWHVPQQTFNPTHTESGLNKSASIEKQESKAITLHSLNHFLWGDYESELVRTAGEPRGDIEFAAICFAARQLGHSLSHAKFALM